MLCFGFDGVRARGGGVFARARVCPCARVRTLPPELAQITISGVCILRKLKDCRLSEAA